MWQTTICHPRPVVSQHTSGNRWMSWATHDAYFLPEMCLQSHLSPMQLNASKPDTVKVNKSSAVMSQWFEEVRQKMRRTRLIWCTTFMVLYHGIEWPWRRGPRTNFKTGARHKHWQHATGWIDGDQTTCTNQLRSLQPDQGTSCDDKATINQSMDEQSISTTNTHEQGVAAVGCPQETRSCRVVNRLQVKVQMTTASATRDCSRSSQPSSELQSVHCLSLLFDRLQPAFGRME